MSPRRQLSWRAKQESIKIRDGGKRAAVSWWGDIINPKLLPLKLTFFFIMGATQCTGPYMTLVMKAVGFTEIETGYLHSVSSLLTILSPFIAGCIADKMGNFKITLIISVSLSGLLSLSYIFIPPARTTPNYSSEINFDLTCGQNNFIITPNLKGHECDFMDEPISSTLNAYDCGYICYEPAISYPTSLKKHLKDVALRININKTIYYTCEFRHQSDDGNQKCYKHNSHKSYSNTNMPLSFTLHNVELNIPLFKENFTEIEILNPKMTSSDTKAHCPNGDVPQKIKVPIMNLDNDKFEMKQFNTYYNEVECEYHCQVSLPHNLTCKDQSYTKEKNLYLSFGLYMGTDILSKFLTGFSYTLFEIAALSILKHTGNDYGLQRVYGSIGGMVFAPLTGYLIDLLGKDHYTDYIIAFVMRCFVKNICCIILCSVNLDFRSRPKSTRRNICSLFFNLEVILLMIVVTISGILYGFIESFLPWHLHELGGKDFLIGILTSVSSAAALPFLVLSDPICKKFGHVQSMVFGLLCYGIRCIGYSMIKDPWHSIPFEVLEGITTGLLVATAVIYGAKLATNANIGTLQGILASLHYGIGKGAGSFIGGNLMVVIGAEKSFLIFSGIALITGFIYYILLKLVIQPRQAKRDKYRREVMNMPVKIVPRHSMTEEQLILDVEKPLMIIPKFTSTPKKSKHELENPKFGEETEISLMPDTSYDKVTNPFDPEYDEDELKLKVENDQQHIANNDLEKNNQSKDHLSYSESSNSCTIKEPPNGIIKDTGIEIKEPPNDTIKDTGIVINEPPNDIIKDTGIEMNSSTSPEDNHEPEDKAEVNDKEIADAKEESVNQEDDEATKK